MLWYQQHGETLFVINGESMFYQNYTLNNEKSDFQKDGYIQIIHCKTITIANSEIYYIDFETTVLGINKTTTEPEPLQEYPRCCDGWKCFSIRVQRVLQ